MEKDKETKTQEEVKEEDLFPEDFTDDLGEDFEDNDIDEKEEFFKQNPLKAIWMQLNENEEKLDSLLNFIENEESEEHEN